MNKRGFTLIELVMIIVILGILAAVAIPRYVDLATDAKYAVLDGSVGAVKSAAVIQYARTKTPNSFLTVIVPQTELDATVTVAGTCAAATATYSGGSPQRSFSLNSAYCSG